MIFFLTRLSTVEAKGPGLQRHKSSLTEGPFCRRRALEAAAKSKWRALVLKAEVSPPGRVLVAKEEMFWHEGGAGSPLSHHQANRTQRERIKITGSCQLKETQEEEGKGEEVSGEGCA